MNNEIAFVWDCPNCGLDQREIQTTDGPWIDLECSYCGKPADGKLNDRSRLAWDEAQAGIQRNDSEPEGLAS